MSCREHLLLLLVAGIAAPALGQAQKEGDNLMAPAPARGLRFSPPGGWTDGFTAVQANVGPNGQNIVGDAANEPSLAVDSTAPNRIAIGWRQFDSITSNFRQAGRAWSNDGGRTWHNPGVLTPGQFRSDPVLDCNAEGRFCYMDIGDANTFAIDVFNSSDAGANWPTHIPAYGGDKAWIAVDRTGGVGNGYVYAQWDYATQYLPNGFTRSIE